MKLINALLTHAWLAFSFRHNGEGLPSKLPAACLLVILYVCLTLANKHIMGGMDGKTIAGLFFVSQFYLFGLRNHFVGLIILISVVINALTLALTTLGGVPPEQLGMLMVMESLMIFAGIINVIKSSAGTAEP